MPVCRHVAMGSWRLPPRFQGSSFVAPPKWLARSRRSWISPSQAPSVRNSSEWVINSSFLLSMRSAQPQKLLLLLCIKSDVAWIHDRNDKPGFPMKRGVLTHGSACLLLSKGCSCYRPRRTGGSGSLFATQLQLNVNLSVLNLAIIKKNNWEKNISGLTLTVVFQGLGLKWASRVQKLFGL